MNELGISVTNSDDSLFLMWLAMPNDELERIKKQIEKQQTLLVKMTAASEDYSKVVDKIYVL